MKKVLLTVIGIVFSLLLIAQQRSHYKSKAFEVLSYNDSTAKVLTVGEATTDIFKTDSTIEFVCIECHTDKLSFDIVPEPEVITNGDTVILVYDLVSTNISFNCGLFITTIKNKLVSFAIAEGNSKTITIFSGLSKEPTVGLKNLQGKE